MRLEIVGGKSTVTFLLFLFSQRYNSSFSNYRADFSPKNEEEEEKEKE